ncbi:MAG: type I methionyl aminopeptidase [Planctomycetota bacterium]|nr:MAG: type I methionyl aminopeptidase [Planctomycetota bacterium]
MDLFRKKRRPHIELKSPRELQKMRDAGKIVAQCHEIVREMAKPGVSGLEIDRAIRDFILKEGGTPLFYQYRVGKEIFPANCCFSINEEVVHGIPSKRRLKEGDIVSVDVGVGYKGFVGDAAITVGVGKVSPTAQKVMDVCKKALELGIQQMVPGNRLMDIAQTIQQYVEGEGFSVVRQFVGHGVGRSMHEDPQVPNFVDSSNRGELSLKLEPGLCLAIEPMVNEGTHKVKVLSDGWTVVTADRKLSAHFEHSVAVTKDGPMILTLLDNTIT